MPPLRGSNRKAIAFFARVLSCFKLVPKPYTSAGGFREGASCPLFFSAAVGDCPAASFEGDAPFVGTLGVELAGSVGGGVLPCEVLLLLLPLLLGLLELLELLAVAEGAVEEALGVGEEEEE